MLANTSPRTGQRISLWFVDWREVASMRDDVAHQHAITLVAGTSLTARYQQAFQAMGCDVTAVAATRHFRLV
ncbi:2-dehydro-3-deoxygalactonokinase [Shigella flexneri]